MTEIHWLPAAFLCLLSLQLLVVSWLEARQRAHVRAHQHQVPSPFQTEVSPSEHLAAAQYTAAKSKLSAWSAVHHFAEGVFWVLGSGLMTLQSLVHQGVGTGLLADLVFIGAFAVIHALLHSPLSLYSTFVIEARHGFNRTTLQLWLSDQIKGLVIAALIGLPIMAALIQLMAAGGSWWWIWAWVIWMGFQLLLMVIAPRFLLPLFNAFKPFEDQTIRPQAEALMESVGFKAKDFQVMDASRRSSHANAFFTGLGSEKRVIFFDTLLEKLNAGEVIAVLAHELGHFKLRHVLWMYLSQTLFSGVFFYALDLMLKDLSWLQELGLHPISSGHPHALLFLSLYWLLPPVLFFLKPLSNALSRRREFQADAFARMHAQAQDLHHALIKLYRGNSSTLTPDPVYVWFHHSHPPAQDRLMKLHV